MNRITLLALMAITAGSPAFAATKVLKKPTANVATASGPSVESKIVNVSDSELTTLVFLKPVSKKIMFQGKNTVLAAPPEYFAGETQAVVQFFPSKTPIQMVVPYVDGSIQTVRLQPTSMPGKVQLINHNVSTSKWVPAATTKSVNTEDIEGGSSADASAAFSDDISLLKDLVATGKVSMDFDKVALPKPVAYDLFTVVPLNAWSNGIKRIMVFQLVANGSNTAVVSNTQFYREGINAVLVTGDVVDSQNSPLLYVVEEL